MQIGSRRQAVALPALAAAAGLVARRLFLVPRVDAPVAADAVVALDGDRPRRLRAAVALAAAGVAPVLVVVRADGVAPELVAAAELPFELISFVPDPSTTRGEARAVAALARERGWRRLVVVTSTYHVTRARMIFRCAVRSELRFVSAGSSRRRLPRHAFSESAKLALALVVRRSP
jgi:uncharacterized SAM-binding protein YcdF (DUF218 family)